MLPLRPIPHTDLKLSALCLGAGAFGLPRDEMLRLYEQFRGAGGNCFDTAHCYSFWLPNGLGAPERALGDAIRHFVDRDNIVVITKGGHPGSDPDYPRPDFYLAPEVVAGDIAESLERLQIETIDFYFLHRDDDRVPVSETIDGLNRQIAAGRLRAIGASNWSTARMAEANAYAAANGLHGFTASQPQFNLGHPNAPIPTTEPAMRYLTADDIAWHTSANLPAICYASTANGYFASNGERGRETYDNAVSRARLQRTLHLAAEIGASPNQVALAFLMSQPFPTIPILGTANAQHLQDALDAAAIALTPKQVGWLYG
jgi:aryl-alcohol dehydrogenase-like predicted oxidoreductase